MIAKLKHADQVYGPPLERGARIAFFIAAGLAMLVFILLAISAITHPYSLDYGEAVMVDQSLTVMRGDPLYRPTMDTPPYTISNYPPVYILALIPFIKLFGPSYWAGRLVSLIGGLAAAYFTGLTIYALTKDRLAALAAALTMIAIPYVSFWSSLERIDTLALGLAAAALYLLVRHADSPWGFYGGALLLVGAIYTRQSYMLAYPFAAFVWLCSRDWKQGWKRGLLLAAVVGGLTLALFLALNITSQGGFYYNLVTVTKTSFGMERLKWNLNRFWEALPYLSVLAGLAALALTVGRARGGWLALAFLISGSASALTIGKIGSNVNYFLELCAALSLAAGLLLAWARRSPALRAIILLALAVQAAQSIKITNREYVADILNRRSKAAELARLQDIVAQANGPVLADEYMGMVTMLGQPIYIQPFSMAQMVNDGLWDESAFLADIRAKKFPLILIHFFPGFDVYKERWSPGMIAAINEAYITTDILADTHVYRPRPDIQASTLKAVTTCGAGWPLPTAGALGLKDEQGVLTFYGHGNSGTLPVLALADGQLTRLAQSPDTLLVRYMDPRLPGRLLWAYYGGLMSYDGATTFIDAAFAPGAQAVPVSAGQTLGYQGNWSGKAMTPTWVHLAFALVEPAADGSFPATDWQAHLVDPSLYLGLQIQPTGETQPVTCR